MDDGKLKTELDAIATANGRYWIQPGICATHKSSGMEVCVDNIVTRTEGDRKFVKGVQCHWIDQNGGYQKGMFLTMELEPCNK